MRQVLAVAFIIGIVAAPVAQAASWSGDVKIKTVEVSNVNLPGTWVSFTTPVGHTCPNQGGQFLLGGGADNVTKMQSIGVTAMVSSRNVSVYWGGGCSGGYPVLLGLTIK